MTTVIASFTTESGSIYEFSDDHKVRRLNDVHTLRRDSEWITLLNDPWIEIGEGTMLMLDLRGDGVMTTRETSSIVSVSRSLT